MQFERTVERDLRPVSRDTPTFPVDEDEGGGRLGFVLVVAEWAVTSNCDASEFTASGLHLLRILCEDLRRGSQLEGGCHIRRSGAGRIRDVRSHTQRLTA